MPPSDLLTGAEPPPTDADLIRCVEREIEMRRRVYKRRVHDGKMTQGAADREIMLMEHVLAKLKGTDQ